MPVMNRGVEIVRCQIVGNRLIEAMAAADLSQEETARRTGIVTSRQLTRLINGEHCPSLERAVALSTVLGFPVDELFNLKIQTRAAQKVA